MESKVVISERNPYEKANIFSKIFLTWSFSLFFKGYKNGIAMADLWQARKRDHSGLVGDRLEKAWELELDNQKKYGLKPSLTKAIVRSFWLEYMLCGIQVALLYIIVWPLIPYTLSIFIDYFSQDPTPATYRRAHIFNFLMNLCSVMSAILYSHTLLSQGTVGMRVRIACCSLMYRKILKLNSTGLGKTEPGQVINLMSNDVSRFDLVSLYLHHLWLMPIVVTVVSYLIWQHIGIATLAALAVSFIQTVFVQAYLSNIQGTYRGKIAVRTDERVKVMSELVKGVQVIKMYAWEKPFQKLVDGLRKVEVSFILKTSLVKGFTIALGVFTERFILFAGIVTFVLLGGEIRPQTTFALVQYFNVIQLACSIHFPLAQSFLAETKVSIKRIEEFLLLDEKETKVFNTKTMPESKPLLSADDEKECNGVESKSKGLSIANVSASWTKDSIVDNLRNITLSAEPGQFIGIAGSVGSGKSTLLQLILGELETKQGTVSLGGSRLSYASQEPWLFVATVRENILFGLPFDRVRYKKVVKACALLKDFELLPHGDSTLVGERGISLSGGQRARIGLARACYRQADIYLLDDPLSAVDTHVGKHLVSECIRDLLSDSTRILVTHQLHHLKEADKVFILRHGEVEIQGTFEEVSSTPLFAELLQNLETDEEEAGDHLPLARSNSTKSLAGKRATEGQKLDDPEQDEEEVEEMSGSGRVPASVYTRYFSAGSGWFLLSCMVFSVLIAQAITSVSDLWLTYWMNNVETQYTRNASREALPNLLSSNSTNITEFYVPENLVTTTISSITTIATNLTSDVIVIEHHGVHNMFYIYIWTAAIAGCIILTTLRSALFLWSCMRSSIKLHNQMFINIMGATMRFFDTNPSGRILNRFSKDMGVVDEILPKMGLETIQIFMVMLGILVMVAIVNPSMLLATAVCGVAMYFWTSIYLNTAQGIKRVEAVARSPVFSHVVATMAGLGTARANDAQRMLQTQFDDKQDVHTAAWYLNIVTNNAFGLWLSLMCSLYVAAVSYTFLFWSDGDTQSGNVGLAISQGLILVIMVPHGVRQGSEVIVQMTSVERILQFTSLPQEKKTGSSPPENWPQKGRIVLKDLSLRYSVDSEAVLNNLSDEIESGWKVGVVGRTGAGKSSLISALFQLAPTTGHISIDGLNIEQLTLKDLRSKISIIPQEPVLFSASLRYNMDPFEQYSDADIWQALEQVELKSSVSSLSAPVTSGGTNFSAGQRQLLCLARAALARNKILVLDEATANVDPTTDALIQKSIRKHFVDCTVITVAHRLHTIADSDRVIVMAAGEIIERGHPFVLLKNKDGHFSQMVKELGAASEFSLREIASKAYSKHTANTGTKDSLKGNGVTEEKSAKQ